MVETFKYNVIIMFGDLAYDIKSDEIKLGTFYYKCPKRIAKIY